MSALGLKMLLRKREAAQSIVAIALLVAILASTNSIINYIEMRVETLGGLVSPGATYVILGRNSTSAMDSEVDAELARKLENLDIIECVLPQKILSAEMAVGSASYRVQVRGVEDVGDFLKARGACVNGSVARGMEADAGEILARVFQIGIGDEVSLAVGDRRVELRVVGVFRSQAQSDAELVVPMEIADALSGNDKVSLIELSLKGGADSREALVQIAQLLPEDVKLLQAQQLNEFLRRTSAQTLAFMNAWSIAVYAAIAAASYVIATRLVAESSYELAMLRALGARRLIPLALVLAYIITVASLGSILGMALGTAGAQIASRILGWIKPSVEITPFLEAGQALRTLVSTLASSILGCLYPALKSMRTRYVEQPL